MKSSPSWRKPLMPFESLSSYCCSRLGDDLQPLSFGIIPHFARRIETHRCAGIGRICWPVRQTAVVGVPSPRETHPRRAHLFRQYKGAQITGTVVIAKLGIVEHERDFSSVEGAGTIIQYRSPPGIDISVCRRRT